MTLEQTHIQFSDQNTPHFKIYYKKSLRFIFWYLIFTLISSLLIIYRSYKSISINTQSISTWTSRWSETYSTKIWSAAHMNIFFTFHYRLCIVKQTYLYLQLHNFIWLIENRMSFTIWKKTILHSWLRHKASDVFNYPHNQFFLL